ncbi:hypothetical protein L210DRAFT_3418953, partial [Boletus edulis BED1]
EPTILKKISEIAQREPDILNHVPEMVFFHVFSDCSTAIIHECLNLPKEGAQILYLIVFQELMPITKLIGDPFLECWWDTVKCECHLALWRNAVHRCDVSNSNLMYKSDGSSVIGILNDFDLATVTEGVADNQCTETVPFMALKLLTKDGLGGKIKHIYAHDAESFIWVLTWICLCYEDDKLYKHGWPLDDWLKVNVHLCGMEKLFFLILRIL